MGVTMLYDWKMVSFIFGFLLGLGIHASTGS